MDSTHLNTFLTVADLGSFSAAAEHLYLTQPAVSKRIAALEQELNARLFDRIGRQVSLTEAGAILVKRARNIVADIEDSTREIQNLSGRISGSLNIGTSHHIGLHRLPNILRAFTSQYAEVELHLEFMDSETVCAEVQHGTLELGIITLPLQPAESLRTLPLWQDQLQFVVGVNHKLADTHGRRTQTTAAPKSASATLLELSQYPAILPSQGTFTREIIDTAFAADSLEIKTKMVTNYLETIKMLVSVGLGWSVLPSTMIDKELTVLNVNGVQLSRNLGMVWHAARTISNAAQQMIDLCKETQKVSSKPAV